MTATVSHFKVGNGDMTLFRLNDGRRLLVDINIRPAAVDPDDDTPNVIEQLRERLERDADGQHRRRPRVTGASERSDGAAPRHRPREAPTRPVVSPGPRHRPQGYTPEHVKRVP